MKIAEYLKSSILSWVDDDCLLLNFTRREVQLALQAGFIKVIAVGEYVSDENDEEQMRVGGDWVVYEIMLPRS